jgi:molecular chaperone HscB
MVEAKASDAGVPVRACWSCRGPAAARDRFCPTCGLVQEPAAIDHFARLDLEPRFDLETAAIEARYFALQRQFHPDRFAAKSARERALSLRHATALNEAYRVLKDPLGRAEHLLALAGRPVRADGAETVNDPVLLMEAMETRDQLAEADSTEAVDALLAASRDAAAALEARFAKAYAAGDLAAATGAALALRYRMTLIDEARARRARMGLS